MTDAYADALGITSKAETTGRVDSSFIKPLQAPDADILRKELLQSRAFLDSAKTPKERTLHQETIDGQLREMKRHGISPSADAYADALGIDGTAPVEQKKTAQLISGSEAPKGQGITQAVGKVMPIPGVKLASMLAQTKGPAALSQPLDTSLLADAGKRLGAGAVSIGDTLANSISGGIKQIEYAGSRAYGNTPEEATRQSNNGIGSYFENPVSKFVNSAGKLLSGSDPKIEASAGYKSEASQKIMQFVGDNMGKGADWISKQTGAPKADIENMMNTALAGVTPAIGKGVGKAAAKTSATLDGWSQELAGSKPLSSVLDAGKAPPVPAAKPRLKLSNDGSVSTVSPPEVTPTDAAQYGSVGSSGASVLARIGAASEHLKADAMAQIENAKRVHGNDWGNQVHWQALDRHLNADSLPVPGRLTEGQARGDGGLISKEWNERSKNGMMPIFEEQNQVMAENLKHLRDNAAPDVYGNSNPEHATTVIKSYEDLLAKEKGSINAKWEAIRKTSSDQMIFDASEMLKDSESALKQQKLTTHDPDGQLTELRNSIKSGGMTADEFVNWRQNLGLAAMKGGSEGKAASTMLKASNNSKLRPEAEQYRSMVNEALAEGRALHVKLKDDPAYKAVSDGRASVDNFIQKHLIGSTAEKVTKMRDNLAHDDVAHQTLSAALLDHLREGAALDNKYKGTFAADAFKKRINVITTKGGVVFKNGELQRLGALSEYASDAKFNAAGGYKNWSNTHTAEIATPGNAAMSKVGEMAGHAAEGLLAAKTGGLSSLLTGPLRAAAKVKAEAKVAAQERQNQADYLHKATRPAAGLIK